MKTVRAPPREPTPDQLFPIKRPQCEPLGHRNVANLLFTILDRSKIGVFDFELHDEAFGEQKTGNYFHQWKSVAIQRGKRRRLVGATPQGTHLIVTLNKSLIM